MPVIDEAGFVAELRRLKALSGLSFRQLERQAEKAGDSLPASTAATMLGKNRLPREDLLVTFVGACGAEEDEVAEWVTARAEIIDPPTTRPSRMRSVQLTQRWQLAVAAAALILAFSGGAAPSSGLSSGLATEHESTATTP